MTEFAEAENIHSKAGSKQFVDGLHLQTILLMFTCSKPHHATAHKSRRHQEQKRVASGTEEGGIRNRRGRHQEQKRVA